MSMCVCVCVSGGWVGGRLARSGLVKQAQTLHGYAAPNSAEAQQGLPQTRPWHMPRVPAGSDVRRRPASQHASKQASGGRCPCGTRGSWRGRRWADQGSRQAGRQVSRADQAGGPTSRLFVIFLAEVRLRYGHCLMPSRRITCRQEAGACWPEAGTGQRARQAGACPQARCALSRVKTASWQRRITTTVQALSTCTMYNCTSLGRLAAALPAARGPTFLRTVEEPKPRWRAASTCVMLKQPSCSRMEMVI